MKILIFGANGFLGKETTELLKCNDFEVFTISRINKNCDYNLDISNFKDFSVLPNNFFDVIINCATVLPGGNYLDNDYLDKIYKTNVLGSQNICKWIDGQQSIKKIINCSTLAVAQKPWKIDLDETVETYPHGNHVLYSSSKLMQELLFKTLAESNKIDLVQIRFSALYGKSMNWNGIICNLIDQAKNKKGINLTNATKVFADFLNVKDAAKIILDTIQKPIIGILNAASGKEISILNLAEMIANNCVDNIEIKNNESENIEISRAKINIDKLNKYIDTSNFIHINEGIKALLTR